MIDTLILDNRGIFYSNDIVGIDLGRDEDVTGRPLEAAGKVGPLVQY